MKYSGSLPLFPAVRRSIPQVLLAVLLSLAWSALAPPAAAQPTLQGGELTSGVPVKFTLGPISDVTLFGNWTIKVPADATQLKVELELATPDVTLSIYTSMDPVILTLGAGGSSSVSIRCGATARPSSGYARINLTPSSEPCAFVGGSPYIAIVMFTKGVTANVTVTATVYTILLGGELTSGVPVKFTLGPTSDVTLFGNWPIKVPVGATQLKVELELATPGVTLDLYASMRPVILTVYGGGSYEITSVCSSSARPSSGYAVINLTPSTWPSTGCVLGGSWYIAIIMYTKGVTANVTVTATVSMGPPALNAGGITNAASFTPGAAAAGGMVSVFGTNLASSSQVATSVPLPTALGGTSFRLGGQPVPLFYVSPLQANLQIPWELAAQSQASLTVTAGGATSSATTVSLASATPGIFTIDQSGKGQGAILLASTGEMAAPSGSIPGRAARPAARGEFLSIFGTGLGAVSNQPASGAVSPSSPLAATTATATVTIGGVPATVSFSGLAPGFVALYQVNVQVPQNAPTGSAVPIVLSIGGVSSNSVTIAVQ